MTRSDNRYVGLAAKSLVRELLWHVAFQHEPGPDPNILLFATRRGGSTFAMELIGANRGIRSLNQPYEMSSAFPAAALVADMPLFEDGQLTSLDARSEERLRALTEGLLAGKVVVNAPTRVWRRDVERRSNRLVLKITDAKPLIGWFSETFPCDIVYLTRHPIPQSLSCLRNGWSLTAAAYLRDDRFVEANLSDDALAAAHDVMRQGTPLQQFVLNWALENVAPLRLLPENPAWLHVRYEDCVTRPDEMVEVIAARLGLTDFERMRAAVNRPSVSSGLSTEHTRQMIETGRAAEAVTGWRRGLDDGTEAWCDRLLERFGIDPHVVLPPV